MKEYVDNDPRSRRLREAEMIKWREEQAEKEEARREHERFLEEEAERRERWGGAPFRDTRSEEDKW